MEVSKGAERAAASVGVGALVTTLTATAFAQYAPEPVSDSQSTKKQATMLLGVERAFGLRYGVAATELESDGVFNVGLGLAGPAIGLFTMPYEIPRLSIDGVIGRGATIGLGAGIAVSQPEGNGDGIMTLIFAPRVGYLHWMGHHAAFWPRVGISYFKVDIGSSSLNGMAATLEAQFLLTPLEHFAITLGPTADVAVLGDSDTDGKLSSYGLNVGFLGYW